MSSPLEVLKKADLGGYLYNTFDTACPAIQDMADEIIEAAEQVASVYPSRQLAGLKQQLITLTFYTSGEVREMALAQALRHAQDVIQAEKTSS